MERIDISGIPQHKPNSGGVYRRDIRDAIKRLEEQEFTTHQLYEAMKGLPEYRKTVSHIKFKTMITDCIRDMVANGELERIRAGHGRGRAGIYRNPRKDSSDTM